MNYHQCVKITMNKPLPVLWRPKKISDVVGQKHLFSENSFLNRMVKCHQPYSLIFYGPPGIGKTSISLAIANELNVPFSLFNAVIDDKAKLVNIIELAKKSINGYILICEEIHRLNKDKQDILLPFLENGTIYIFASTTENPYFIVNPAIRSRCHILELKPLTSTDIYDAIKHKIIENPLDVKLTDDIIKMIAESTNGDFRAAINVIDILNTLYKDVEITPLIIQQIIGNNCVIGSKYGDSHYDLLSAFHKSLRGSDPDAAIYYLAQLLLIGDLVAINRRLLACCYEDIGLANPSLCARVSQAINAAMMVGFPECKQIYATVVIEMCLSLKSNSAYMAINNAIVDIQNKKQYPIPNHIKDESYKSAKKLNRTGYKYPHDYENNYVQQQYLPNALIDKKYYIPGNNQIEQKLNSWLKWLKSKK